MLFDQKGQKVQVLFLGLDFLTVAEKCDMQALHFWASGQLCYEAKGLIYVMPRKLQNERQPLFELEAELVL